MRDQRAQVGLRVPQRDLGGHDARGLVVRVRQRPRILRRRLQRDGGAGQRDQDRGDESNQAVCSAAAMEGRITSGTLGISGGYGSAAVTWRNPTESSNPLISSPTSSPCAISASAA